MTVMPVGVSMRVVNYKSTQKLTYRLYSRSTLAMRVVNPLYHC